MSRMAQQLQRQVDELRAAQRTGRRPRVIDEDPPAGGEAGESGTGTGQQEETMAKKEPKTKKPKTRAAKVKAPKAARPARARAKQRAPKHKYLFVNTDGALAVMHRSLKLALGQDALSEAERADAEKLVSRLERRGVPS